MGCCVRQPGSTNLPADKAGLDGAIEQLVQALPSLGLSPELVLALQRSADSIAHGRLSLFEDAPNPFVCRTCGYILLGEPADGAQLAAPTR